MHSLRTGNHTSACLRTFLATFGACLAVLVFKPFASLSTSVEEIRKKLYFYAYW